MYDSDQPAAPLCEYNAFLACGEPGDDAIEASRVALEFEYSFLDQHQRTVTDTEYIALDGHTYRVPNHDLYRHLTHRSLLVAQMEFIRRLIDKGREQLLAYECISRDPAYDFPISSAKFFTVERLS